MSDAIELEPEQPDEVVRAVEALLEVLLNPGEAAEPDPWWRAGIVESLDA